MLTGARQRESTLTRPHLCGQALLSIVHGVDVQRPAAAGAKAVPLQHTPHLILLLIPPQTLRKQHVPGRGLGAEGAGLIVGKRNTYRGPGPLHGARQQVAYPVCASSKSVPGTRLPHRSKSRGVINPSLPANT
jgi:hypothetical protein